MSKYYDKQLIHSLVHLISIKALSLACYRNCFTTFQTLTINVSKFLNVSSKFATFKVSQTRSNEYISLDRVCETSN